MKLCKKVHEGKEKKKKKRLIKRCGKVEGQRGNLENLKGGKKEILRGNRRKL